MKSMEIRKSVESAKRPVTSSPRLFDALNGSISKLQPERQPIQVQVDSDIFVSFRGFLILGRCVGLIPCSGVCKRSYTDLKCRIRSFAGLCNLSCLLLLAFNAGLAIADSISIPKRNAYDIARSIGNPVFGLWGMFMYTYFLLRGKQFIKIFKIWKKSNMDLTYTLKDKTLKWTIIILSTVMFSSTILENAVLNMEYFAQFDDINGHTARYGEESSKDAPVIQMYYWRAHINWNAILGYHPLLSILAFINHKLILYGGNYMDIMVSLFARALHFKFHALCQVADKILLQPMENELGKSDTYVATDFRQAWNQFAKDHDLLCDVLNIMNDFFSPIIFVSYTVNIYFFCMQLLLTLNPDFTKHSIVHSIYSPWSFIHVIVRVFVLSLSLARVNEYAHKAREIVMRCPIEVYGGPIAKLDKKVNVGPKLGLTGLGTFTVTKPFMLSILNVVFTIEIVLLQGISTTSSGSNSSQTNCTKST